MTKTYLFGAVALIGIMNTAPAHAAPISISDGCYQLVETGALLTTICISGGSEEGIGGSNAQIAQIDPNGAEVLKCETTTKIKVENDSTTFFVGRDFFQFFPESEHKGKVMDETHSKYDYIRLESSSSLDILHKSIEKSHLCK